MVLDGTLHNIFSYTKDLQSNPLMEGLLKTIKELFLQQCMHHEL